jgi:zinc-ribbon domain
MIVICPKCGEDNSNNFRFCGMCGTLLEVRRPAGAPVPGLPTIANAPEPLRPPVLENATRPANKQVPSIGGPSVLGLNQPGANPPSPNQPSMDSLRDRAFSGLDSFFEPEQPKTGGRRILLLVALLVALGGAGWWTYTNYLGATESRKPEPATSSAGEAPAEKPSTKPAAKDAAPALDAGSSQAVVPSGEVPQSQAENARAGPDATRKTVDAAAKPAPKAKSVTPAKIARADKNAAKRAPSVTPAKASKLPAPAAADTGDAAFRKGEAYLYGRGVPKNCDEAVKYLKAASAKSSAKARSAFGAMYATGHCVQRDLPTSYLWFALALRVDPNNQILEKDLSAVWNQMTPPERQMATRMKQ